MSVHDERELTFLGNMYMLFESFWILGENTKYEIVKENVKD